MANDKFELKNDPPPSKKPEPNPKETQRVLFAGMNCLPGQQDLFETDGSDDEARS